MALNRGFTAPIVMALGGGKTERMMRRYAAVTDVTLRAAAEAVSGTQNAPSRRLASGEMPDHRRGCCLICWNFRSTALGTISACNAEHGVRSSLGTGGVSNTGNNVHSAKRPGVEVARPPPWPGHSRLG